MRNPVSVASALLGVQLLLYTTSLCAPQWLVDVQGASEGLFALCSAYQGFASCTTFPAWLGTYSLSWMFLSVSSLLCLLALLSVRPALARGRRALAAMLLNVVSVALCVGALVSFVVSVERQEAELLRHLGWTFYICCASVPYASAVSALLGVVRGQGARVQPANAAANMAVISA